MTPDSDRATSDGIRRRLRTAYPRGRANRLARDLAPIAVEALNIWHVPPHTAHVTDRWHQAKTGLKVVRNLAKDAAKRALEGAEEAAKRVDAKQQRSVAVRSPSDLQEPQGEPPVVARLMIEIRSDGTQTIARGAMQDELSGEKVAIEAKGNSPLELAAQLAKVLVTAPLGLGALGKALLTTKKP